MELAMTANLICVGPRFVCYNQDTREVMWLKKAEFSKHPGFGPVSWNTRELAEDRARQFGEDAKVLTVNI